MTSNQSELVNMICDCKREGKGKKKDKGREVYIVLCRLVVLYSGANLSKCVINAVAR